MNTKWHSFYRQQRMIICLMLLLMAAFSIDDRTSGQEPTEPPMEPRINVPLKTSGGNQFWTDFRYFDGYRLQQNALTRHWRVLDPNDIRRAWGSRQDCLEHLGTLRSKSAGQPLAPKHTVILLHGLMRTRRCMKSIESSLPDYHVIRFSYASTRNPISQHADALGELIGSQPSDTTFSFVGHSLGNIVVRHLIGNLQRDGDPKGILPRCRSMVMLGPPNQGSAIARRLAPTKVFGFVTGISGAELGTDWKSFADKLATPPFPFLIIAGDVSANRIQNPLVDGASDYVVSVDETRLDGAVSLETYPVIHASLMNDSAIIQRTVEFIGQHTGQ